MNTILISIIAIPIIEIMIFIKIGENIGAINTILLIFFTAVVGVYFARIQGIKTLKNGLINMYQNKLPFFMRYYLEPQLLSPHYFSFCQDFY